MEHQDHHKRAGPGRQYGVTSSLDWVDQADVYPRAVVGEPAPHFHAMAYQQKEFKTLSLDQFKGRWVCLFFYPLDFTFVCPTEILAFADSNEEFNKLNCTLIGASVDSEFSHFQWCNLPRNKGGLGDIEIPLLSDITKAISRIYGCLITKGADAGLANRYYTITLEPHLSLMTRASSDMHLTVIFQLEEMLKSSSDSSRHSSMLTSTEKSALPSGNQDPRP